MTNVQLRDIETKNARNNQPGPLNVPSCAPTPTSAEAELAMAEAVLEAIADALDGRQVSDFMESFTIVRKVLDLKQSVNMGDSK